jgi:hypothetical protein
MLAAQPVDAASVARAATEPSPRATSTPVQVEAASAGLAARTGAPDESPLSRTEPTKAALNTTPEARTLMERRNSSFLPQHHINSPRDLAAAVRGCRLSMELGQAAFPKKRSTHGVNRQAARSEGFEPPTF